MAHNLNLLTTVVLITASLVCPAMEILIIEKKNPTIVELTCTQKTRQALYLRNNHILVSDSEGCKIIDPTTDTIIKKISSSKNPHLALHPDYTKFAVAYRTKISLYNAKTRKKEWICETYPSERIASCTFNPCDDTIFISYKTISSITRHAYHYNQTSLFGHRLFQPEATSTTAISFHPTQKTLAISSTNNNWCQHYQTKPEQETIYIGEDYNFCEYSPDGYTLVRGNESCIQMLNLYNREKGEPYKTLLKQPLKPILFIKIHQESSVLATLSGPNGIVSYWSILTNRLINIMPPLYPESRTISSTKNYGLSFSPDGEKLLVTLSGKCFVMNVPFGITSQSRAIFIHWALQNYQRNNPDLAIPDDVMYFLIHILLKT